jgi:rubrerythrin
MLNKIQKNRKNGKTIISYLRKEQKRIQSALKDKYDIDMNYVNNHCFCIWITLMCGKCGNEIRTPFNIRDSGRCPICDRIIFNYKKRVVK